MTAKPVVPRVQARADVDLAIDHYLREAGAEIAIGYIDALEQAYSSIGRIPAAGSSRWSYELGLPGLRTVRLKGFPWLVFYVELKSHVDVWRVLHAKRDIPASMIDAGSIDT